MPWAESDKRNIVKYLGHPFTAQAYDQVQAQMSKVQTVDDGAVAIAQGYLAELTAIDNAIKAARTNLTAGAVIAGGDSPVEFRPGEPINTLKEEGSRYCGLLADVLQTQPRADYFYARSSVAPIYNRRVV